MKRFVVVTVLALVSLFGGTACGWDKVEPGNVGILVDLGNGQVSPIYETKWRWMGWYERIIEWSAGDQTYVMERGDGVGQIKGDDSIECRTSDTQNIKFDVPGV